MFGDTICVLCGREYFGHGNNPTPLAHQGVCCDKCNEEKVIPARLKKPVMTNAQRTAALELGDKLGAFANEFRLSDEWIRAMHKQARVPAKHTTGLDINEA